MLNNRIGAALTTAAFTGLLSPVVATVLGWLVLGQSLTASQITGGAVVLASLVAAQGRAPEDGQFQGRLRATSARTLLSPRR